MTVPSAGRLKAEVRLHGCRNSSSAEIAGLVVNACAGVVDIVEPASHETIGVYDVACYSECEVTGGAPEEREGIL